MNALPSVIEAGVDYITLTAKHTNSKEGLLAHGHFIAVTERDAGNEQKEWRALGYSGLHCGSVSLGNGSQGAIVRLSGKLADLYFADLLPYADNCSRIDLQATFRYEREPSRVLAQHWREIERKAAKLQKPPKAKIILSRSGAETIMLGSRQSDRYGRIYDKHVESKLDHYKGCLRYEVEFKNNLSRVVARAMSRPGVTSADVLSGVSGFFHDRGCQLRSSNCESVSYRQPTKTADSERQLLWLENSVSALVERLVSRYGVGRVLEALHLDTLAGVNPH